MKSYFNVPDHINNTNRHLGIEKNVRKNKKEPKAKKKHRIARLKFLNNKRNIELFEISINAMHDHIASLIEYYEELRIQEEERIYNLELEKQRVLEEAEIQKQKDIDDYNNFVIDIQKQLDLLPRYRAHMEKIKYENKLIEEEKKRLEQLLLSEKNQKLLDKYQTYFDIINYKKEENLRLAQELEHKTNLENKYKEYIKNKKSQNEYFKKIYQEAVNINNKILDDKISIQKTLDEWEHNIENYNNYVISHANYMEKLEDERQALEHQNKIDNFKNMFIELNNNISVFLQNIDNNKDKLQTIDNENIIETNKIDIDPVKINKAYTEHFEHALHNMKNLNKDRLKKINELKKIEEQQKKMLAKKQLENKNKIKKEVQEFHKSLNERKRAYNEYVERQKILEIERQEKNKILTKNALERKALKLKDEINKFTKDIENFNTQRNIAMKEYEEEQKRIQIMKDNKIKEETERQILIEKRKKHFDLFNSIEKSLKEVQIKQIQEINDKYNEYQAEIIRLEKEKQEKLLLEQEKSRIANEKYNAQKDLLLSLENDYKEIISIQKEEQQQKILFEQRENQKKANILNYFDNSITQMKLAKIQKEQLKLLEEEEAFRLQQLNEYEEKLAYDNNIQYYSQLIIDNQKQHEIFKIQLEEFKKQEIERLEIIKKEEEDNYNKDIVGFSINHLLDLVDVQIENIEYNNTIDQYNDKINQFYKNIDDKKLELEKIAKKQLEEEENERLRIEQEEKYLKELKRQQEEDMMNQINNMLLEFNINTKKHIETIKLQKKRIQEEQAKQEEEERIKLLEIEKLEKEEHEKIIKYYESNLHQHKQHIEECENFIKQKEKEKAEKLKQYMLAEKLRKEKNEKDMIIKHQNLIDKYNNDITTIKNNISLQKQLQIEKEKQIKLEKQRVIDNQKKQQEDIRKKYIQYFSDIIKTNNDNFEKFEKSKEEAKIQYEIEQKALLEAAEKEKELLFKQSLDRYKSNIKNLEKLKENNKIKLKKQKELEEEYEKEKIRIAKEIQDNIEKDFKNKINSFHDTLIKLEKYYEDEKDKAEKEKKLLQEKMIQEQKIQEENNKLMLLELENKYKNDIQLMHNNYASYIENQKKKEEEELLKQLKEKKIAEENYKLHMIELQNKYVNEIQLIQDNYASQIENKKKQEEEELLKQLKEKKIAEEKYKLQMVELQNKYTNEIQIMKDNYASYEQYLKQQELHKKQQEEEELLKQLKEKKIAKENYKLRMIELQNKYKNEIQSIQDNYLLYEENLKKIEEEQILRQKEEEKLAEENYQKYILEYEKTILMHNEKILHSKKAIEDAKIRKENELLEIEKQKELEIKQQKLENLKNYETQINNFYTNQKNVIDQLQNELILEKTKAHNTRLQDLEKEILEKINNIDKSEFIKKLDKTINFIKDISDNQENENYINDLKNQYDNSKIVVADDSFVENHDVISVSDDVLKFSDFDKYNKYMYNVVPKIIYQTWPTKNLTRNMAWVVNRIKTTHPDFEYHLFDDNDCRKFIKEHFGNETLWAFDKLIPGAYKADLWRYCVMYITGGIYLDIKMCPVNGFRFDFLLKSDWYCNDIGNIPGIWQGILVSRPRNPIFKYLIDTVIENVKNEYYGDDPLQITGPRMMKSLLNKLRVKIDTPLQIKKYLNKKASTIAKREYKVGICLDERECLLEYDEYRQECLRTGVHYNEAWKKNMVYDNRIILENYLSNDTE